MNTVQNITEMLADLKNHQRDPHTLLATYVEQRLNKTVDTYYKSVLQSAEILERRSLTKVVKNIVKQK